MTLTSPMCVSGAVSSCPSVIENVVRSTAGSRGSAKHREDLIYGAFIEKQVWAKVAFLAESEMLRLDDHIIQWGGSKPRSEAKAKAKPKAQANGKKSDTSIIKGKIKGKAMTKHRKESRVL